MIIARNTEILEIDNLPTNFEGLLKLSHVKNILLE